MKKTSLLLMGVGLVFGAVAQNAVKINTSKLRIVKVSTLAQRPIMPDNGRNKSMAVSNRNHSVRLTHIVSGYSTQSAAITAEVSMGSSYNAFGVSSDDCRPMTANQDLNLINFTHRQNNGDVGGSGLISSSFATADNACTASMWDSTLMVYNEQYMSYSGGRYPSGVIMNPTGNTVVDSAYIVTSGPITDGTSWIGNYFASSNFGGHHLHDFVIPEPSTLSDGGGIVFQYFACVNSQATDDGVVHVLGERLDPNNIPTSGNPIDSGVVVNRGILDAVADTFKWTQTKIYEDFATGTNGQEYGDYGKMAWSQDGTVGYVVFIGQDATTSYNGTFEPIVFKTTNSGGTWTKMPIFDFSTVTNITDKLPPIQGSSPSLTVPFFYAGAGNGLGLTVDANKNLHIACQINGVANATTSPDNLQVYLKQQLFDVYTTTTGWDALWIDSLNGQYVPAGNLYWTGSPSTENLGYGASLQASRTKDGKKIFYEWTDTDPLLGDTLNEFPNLFAKGFDVTTGLQTPVVNFSEGTMYDSQIFWKFTSDLTLQQGTSPNTVYTIPTSTSINNGEISTNPVQHYYLCSVTFNDNDFVALGVNELSSNKVTVTQNFPNPFSKSTSFTVNLTKTSDVNVKVYNTLGQLIMENNNSNMSAGKHTMNIDAAKLAGGLYFYSVKVGDNIITHKMIVQ